MNLYYFYLNLNKTFKPRIALKIFKLLNLFTTFMYDTYN